MVTYRHSFRQSCDPPTSPTCQLFWVSHVLPLPMRVAQVNTFYLNFLGVFCKGSIWTFRRSRKSTRLWMCIPVYHSLVVWPRANYLIFISLPLNGGLKTVSATYGVIMAKGYMFSVRVLGYLESIIQMITLVTEKIWNQSGLKICFPLKTASDASTSSLSWEM